MDAGVGCADVPSWRPQKVGANADGPELEELVLFFIEIKKPPATP
jgi:hypothetical protein